MSSSAGSADNWTVGRLVVAAAEYLERCGVEDARLAAEVLLAHLLGCERIMLYTRWSQSVSSQQRAAFRDLVREAARGRPVAYIVGRKEFFSLEFEVTPAVMIPRCETETLVEKVLEFCKKCGRPDPLVLDLGTGSGCVAVALAKYLPSVRIVASDISADALEVARRNVERHNVADRVTLVRADWLDLPAEVLSAGRFDVIVSNPPYITQRDFESLPEQIRMFEPSAAFLAGPDGLEFYRRTAGEARRVLKPAGSVFVEVGAGQANGVAEMFAEAGCWRLEGRWRDLLGIERVLHFVLTGDGDGAG